MSEVNRDKLFKDIDGMLAAFIAENPDSTPLEREAFMDGANKMWGYFFANFTPQNPNRLQN